MVWAFTKLTEQQEEERIRLLKEKEGLEQGIELFRIGVKTSEEYIARVKEFIYGSTGLNITLITFPVRLKIGDKEVAFTLQATERGNRDSNKPVSYQLPLPHYDYVSICPVQEDNPYASLFCISSTGHLVTPLKGNNSPEEIKVVSDFLGIMQQSLSETHTPRINISSH